MEETQRWIRKGGRAAVVLLAAIMAMSCSSRATHVSFFRLVVGPKGDCSVSARTSAAYGIGGTELRLSCTDSTVQITRIYRDFLPGSATVTWKDHGETHVLVCNRWSPNQPEIVSFMRPGGRLLDSGSSGYQSLAAKILSEHEEFSGLSPADAISGYCRSDEVFDRFRKANPVLRLNWMGETVGDSN